MFLGNQRRPLVDKPIRFPRERRDSRGVTGGKCLYRRHSYFFFVSP
jgi:hypothetical protein